MRILLWQLDKISLTFIKCFICILMFILFQIAMFIVLVNYNPGVHKITLLFKISYVKCIEIKNKVLLKLCHLRC